jgi:serine/threonine protein kinase
MIARIIALMSAKAGSALHQSRARVPTHTIADPASRDACCLSRYEVVESLRSGGMGEVYGARDSVLRRDVALKVLPVRHRLDSDRQARFRREALPLATLNHPNIATVHGIEDEAGIQALVMELVDGHTLADRIDHAARARGLPIPEALAIARQMVDALELHTNVESSTATSSHPISRSVTTTS